MFTAVPEFSDWAAWHFGAVQWLAWGAAVLGLFRVGICLRPWAGRYAKCLLLGALPDAATLWSTAGRVVRRCRSGWPDAIGAGLWGGGAGVALMAWGWPAFAPLVLCQTMVALAWIDVRSGLLPDALTLPLMVAGWLYGPLSLGVASSASALVWAGLAGFAGGYRWLRGRDGFGSGDVKCLAALAGWLGIPVTVSVLGLACVLGVAFWLCLRCLGQSSAAGHGSPFGPFIAAAAVPAILGGPVSWPWL
jgi:leader peptidase (prepilin peptidase)/N-methyltransferase